MIHREDRDAVTILRLEHGKANALDTELMGQMSRQLDELEGSGTHAVVVTGTDSMFSAGVDLFRLLEGGADYIGEFVQSLSSGLLRFFNSPLPVVAAINGHAIAGGCVLAAACDHRIMAKTRAKIGLTELAVGVPFPAAAMEIVAALVPRPLLGPLLYGAQVLSADEALARGLVDAVAPADGVLAQAIATAERMADVPSRTFALTKRQLRQPVLDLLARQAAQFDGDVLEVWQSQDTHTSIAGFMERTVGKKRD